MRYLTADDGVAVVTGAGSGLGRALSVALCARGMRVVGLGRRLSALEETQEACREGGFAQRVCDMADAAAVGATFDDIARTEGPVALLINNAAVYPRRDFLEETAESFLHSVAVNLGGPVAACRAVLDGMVARGAGRILNVSTFADIAPLPASSAYAVSKGAARILTRALVADLGDRFPGIVIGDWMPGMLRTQMGVPDGLEPAQAAAWGAELALRMDPALTGSVFEQAVEVLPPRGLKGRIKDRLTGTRRAPRRLD